MSAMVIRMTTDGAARLLYLLQVANAAFPTGAFSHSYGFETWIDRGLIHDAAGFEPACRDWLRHGVAGADGAAVAHAHRAAAAEELDPLVALDRIVGALKLGREAREASYKMGRALVSTLAEVFGLARARALAAAVAEGRCQGHQAVIFGAIARWQGIGERDAVLVFLQAALANLAGVAGTLCINEIVAPSKGLRHQQHAARPVHGFDHTLGLLDRIDHRLGDHHVLA